MTELTIPVSSPVPLDVLRKSIAVLAAAPVSDSRWRWDTNTSTRMKRRCKAHGIAQLWMLAILHRTGFSGLANVGAKTVCLAEEILKVNGCTFDAFPQLRVTIESCAFEAGKASGRNWISHFEVCMALAGIGDWAKDPAIAAALAEQGLSPGMPLEELFVYDQSLAAPSEPKQLTVAEELLAFGTLLTSEVFPKGEIFDLYPDHRVIGLMAILACDASANPITRKVRAMFIAAARKRLSPKARKQIGVWTEHREGTF